jgi:hypothetical protein
VIFLVNRLGEVHAIAAPFIEALDEQHAGALFRFCAWCPRWQEAADLARKRRWVMERLLGR